MNIYCIKCSKITKKDGIINIYSCFIGYSFKKFEAIDKSLNYVTVLLKV